MGGIVLGAVVFLYLFFTKEEILSPVKSSPVTQWGQRLVQVHLEVGEKAPEIALVTTGGEALELRSFSGKEVGILFVTSTCPHCDELVRKMNRLRAVESKSLLMVCVDGSAGARKLSEKYGGPFPILVDSLNVVSQAYKVSTVPQLYLLNKEGWVAERLSGGIEVWQALERVFL